MSTPAKKALQQILELATDPGEFEDFLAVLDAIATIALTGLRGVDEADSHVSRKEQPPCTTIPRG